MAALWYHYFLSQVAIPLNSALHELTLFTVILYFGGGLLLLQVYVEKCLLMSIFSHVCSLVSFLWSQLIFNKTERINNEL